MLHRIRYILLLALAAPLFGGGFWLQFSDGSTNAEAKSRNAVLVVKPLGCHNPEQAKVTGRAEGLVDGKRTSMPLTLVPLVEPGAYAVVRTWPKEGSWVLSFSAVDEGRVTGGIAAFGREGYARAESKFMPHSPTPDEINSSLKAVT